jgi:hypothetical protein
MKRYAMIASLFAILSLAPRAPHAQAVCIGDCDGDGSVTIDEIVRMVDIVLAGNLGRCLAGDRDTDGAITVDEVLTAVTNALLGCAGALPRGPDLSRVYPAPLLDVGDQPRAIAVADLDRDGDLDIAGAGADGVSVLSQEDDGGFATTRQFAAGGGAVAVIATHLDEDPRPDLVVVNELSNSVTVALSFDSYTTPIEAAVGDGPVALVAGFFNRDVFFDVAVANRDSGDISILLGDGLGGVAGEQRFDAGGSPIALAVADIDGDGLLDLAAATTAQRVSILLAAAVGGFAPPVPVEVPFTPLSVALAKVDEDDFVDLVVLGLPQGSSNSVVAILLGSGDGFFADPQPVDTGAASNSMAVVDLDGDADVDVVTGNEGSVSVLLGTGDGAFAAPVRPAVNGGAAAVTAADIDADGAVDVAYADPSGNAASILWGLGDGRLAAEEVEAVDGMVPLQILTARLDGDAAPDLLTVNLGSEDVSVLLNDGTGALLPPIIVATEPGLLAAAVGEIEGGGAADLVTAHESDECFDCILAFEGVGDGRFEQRRRLVSTGRIMAVEIADFDGDELGDIVALSSAGVSLFTALGSWTFEAEEQFAAGSQPRGLAAGDLNGDLLPDVAVADGGSTNAAVLFSSSGGGFDAPVFLPLSFAPVRIRVADVDADGMADIIVQGGGRFALLRGEGGGAFAGERRLDGISGGEFDLADVNADGLLDLVALSQGMAIYPGVAGGPFSAPQRFAVNGLAAAVVAVELDGDEVAELVTANAAFEGTVSVLRSR